MTEATCSSAWWYEWKILPQKPAQICQRNEAFSVEVISSSIKCFQHHRGKLSVISNLAEFLSGDLGAKKLDIHFDLSVNTAQGVCFRMFPGSTDLGSKKGFKY